MHFKRCKRWLFLSHRWAGIALCLLFAAWFGSGLFMMYVEFPQLTRSERLAGLPPLDFATSTLTPAAAITHLVPDDFNTIGTPTGNNYIDPATTVVPSAIGLRMLLGRPVYDIAMADGTQPRTVFADTGEILRAVTPLLAERSAADFAVRAGWIAACDRAQVQYLTTLQTDQWTVSSALNAHRPLLLVALHDARGTELYISSRSGAVVRDTHRLERALNYFGAVTHWLYPTFIRRYPDVWSWLVDIVASAGALLALSGLWIGVLRWRRKRGAGKAAVPYRGLMRWHYFAGILFGVTTLSWVSSGLLSMNPGHLNPARSPSAAEAQIFSGTALRIADFSLPAQLFDSQSVEAELVHYNGQPFFATAKRDGSRELIAADASALRPSTERLMASAPHLMPDVAIADARLLTDYDDYYYSRHPERGDKLLPVLRVQFNDNEHTWFYIDSVTGQVIERSTRANRIYRWLYNGLHSWDIRWLWQRRPLWDIAVISFSAGGFGLSVLGAMVGYRRLRHTFK